MDQDPIFTIESEDDSGSTIELAHYTTEAQFDIESFPSTSEHSGDTFRDLNYQLFEPKYGSGSESWSSEDDKEQERRLPKLGVNKKVKKEYTVVRGKVKLRKGKFVETVSEDAVIYMTAVLTYMADNLLDISNKRAVVHLEKQRIEPIDIIYALSFFDEDLVEMFPEAELEYIRFHEYDREDDTSDSINLISENILLDKFTNSYIRFCSNCILWHGSISCRYRMRCYCQQDEQSSSEWSDEPETVIPVRSEGKEKFKKSVFHAKRYRKLKNKKFVKKISPDAAVYLKAVLQHVTEEILELAGHIVTSMPYGVTITPFHLSHAFISDKEIESLYPIKKFSSDSFVFLSGVLKFLVREIVEWAALFARKLRRTRVEPIDILFSMESDADISVIYPSIKFQQERPNYTEIVRFSCNRKTYCCKRLVRSSEVVSDTLGCSGMQLNELPLRKKEKPARLEWSGGIKRKTMTQRRWLKGKAACKRDKLDKEATISWAASTEFLVRLVLRTAGDNALKSYWRRIEPVDLFHAIGGSNGLQKFYPGSKLKAWAKNKLK